MNRIGLGTAAIPFGAGTLLLAAPIFLSIQSDGLPLALMAALTAVLIGAWGFRPAALPRSRWLLVWVLFAVFLTAQSLAVTRMRYVSAIHLAWWWLDVVVLVVAASWSRIPGLVERLATWLLLTQTVLAAGAVVTAVGRGERAEGWLANANGLGSALLWGLMVALSLVLSGVRRRWSAVALGVIGLAWVLTASLTSYAAAIVPLALMVWWHRSRISRRQVVATVAATALIAAVGWTAWNASGRSSLLTSQHVGFSFAQRLEFHRVALEMWQEKPVLGWGVGSFKLTLPRFTRQWREQPLYAHDSYAQMLAESGLAGALGFLGLIFAAAAAGSRFAEQAPDPESRALRRGFFAAWLAFTLAAAVDFGWYYLAGQFWWFFVSGLFIGAGARSSMGPPGAWIRVPIALAVAGVILWGSTRVLSASRLADAGRLALESGEIHRAVFDLDRAARMTGNPEDVQMLAEARRLRGGEPDLERAAAELGASLRSNPDHYSLHHRLGLVLSARADQAATLESFERAYRLDPMFHPEYAHNYAVALFRSGKGTEALAVIDRMLEMYGALPRLQPRYAAEIERLKILRANLERRGVR